jgi:hypothetical protein
LGGDFFFVRALLILKIRQPATTPLSVDVPKGIPDSVIGGFLIR